MARGRLAIPMIVLLATAAAGLGHAPAAFADGVSPVSPAGPVAGAVVVTLPAAVGAAALPSISPIASMGRVVIAPIEPLPVAVGPALPPSLLLTPARGTGSLVVPLRIPLASAAGAPLSQPLVVIAGPNPAQDTSVDFALLLTALLASHQGAAGAVTSASPGLVTVITAPK